VLNRMKLAMAQLSMIDTAMPITLTPHSSGAVSDAGLRALAGSARLPQLLVIDDLTEGAEPLTVPADESKQFLSMVEATFWGRIIERNLQSISQDSAGRPLLTSWLRAHQFKHLVNDARYTRVGDRLERAQREWLALGMESVYFDGYKLLLTDVQNLDGEAELS
jgi:hypothetical protein